MDTINLRLVTVQYQEVTGWIDLSKLENKIEDLWQHTRKFFEDYSNYHWRSSARWLMQKGALIELMKIKTGYDYLIQPSAGVLYKTEELRMFGIQIAPLRESGSGLKLVIAPAVCEVCGVLYDNQASYCIYCGGKLPLYRSDFLR